MASKAIVGATDVTRVTYRDSNDTVTDPGVVVAWVKKPNQTIAQITAITNVSTGIYDVAVALDQPGIWYLKVTATGLITPTVVEKRICAISSSVA
jgi:nitrogen fixation protein FixH